MTWMQTIQGFQFDLDNQFGANLFVPEEVATILARLPRFGGHSVWFYSVAQHSVLVSRCFKSPRIRFIALLHDTPEAYIGDMIQPIKCYLKERSSNDFSTLENKIWNWIASEHKFASWEFADEIKLADLTALASERRDLMVDTPFEWKDLSNPWKETIEPWSQEYARDRFLMDYYALRDKINLGE